MLAMRTIHWFGNAGFGQVYSPGEAKQRLISFRDTLKRTAAASPWGDKAYLMVDGQYTDTELAEAFGSAWKDRTIFISFITMNEVSAALERLLQELSSKAGIKEENIFGQLPALNVDLFRVDDPKSIPYFHFTVGATIDAYNQFIKIYEGAIEGSKFPIAGLVIGLLGVTAIVGVAVYAVRGKRTPTGGRRARGRR